MVAHESTGHRILAALVHQDADGPDPQGARERALNGDLQALGNARAVVPVQMTESWWFLFPEAVERTRPRSWQGTMPRAARDVETIAEPKSVLRRLTSSKGGPPYSEADSTAIAEEVKSSGLAPVGTCASYDRFQQLARSLT